MSRIHLQLSNLGEVMSIGNHSFRSGLVKSISYYNGLYVYINYIDGTQDQVEFKTSVEAKKAYQEESKVWYNICS